MGRVVRRDGSESSKVPARPASKDLSKGLSQHASPAPLARSPLAANLAASPALGIHLTARHLHPIELREVFARESFDNRLMIEARVALQGLHDAGVVLERRAVKGLRWIGVGGRGSR